jgi:hypothetical protein
VDEWIGRVVAVSADGRTAVLGADHADVDGNEDQGAAYVFVRSGTQWQQVQDLNAADGAEREYFGTSVAVSADGQTIAVGARWADLEFGSAYAGAVYVFERSGQGWQQTHKLTASDGSAGLDYFGFSVAISADGDTIAVGWPFAKRADGAVAGAVYVYARSGAGWQQAPKLTSSSAPADAGTFGFSVGLTPDAETLVVGAPSEDVAGNMNQGATYVFERSGAGWQLVQRLTASDGAPERRFGGAVAVSADGRTLLGGAEGAAYVFVRPGSVWEEAQKLMPTVPGVFGGFGNSVALSSDGRTAFVGTPVATSSNRAGAVYVFGLSGSSWQTRQVLMPSDGGFGDEFGRSVAVSARGAIAIIGAAFARVPSFGSPGAVIQGAAYAFARRLQATVDVTPDTLSLRSKGQWVTATVSLPDGYDASTIDPASVFLRYGNHAFPMERGDVEQRTGRLVARFSRSALIDRLVEDQARGPVTLSVEGSITDGTSFTGADTVNVH